MLWAPTVLHNENAVSVRRRSQRLSFHHGIAMVLLGLVVGLVLAEAWVRITRWTPPLQIVRGRGLHVIDGAPVWEDATDRYNRNCVDQYPERIRILFFGSSITFGSGVSTQETFTAGLETRLNQLQPSPGFCILNFAQPGFGFQQKYAVARIEVPRYRPALIMWEDWEEWRDYRLIGDAAYGIGDLAVRSDGFVGMAGVPDGLNRVLFLHSRLYEYLTLAFGERARRVGESPEAFAENRLIQVPRLAESVGAKLVLYLAPPLDRSFAELAASPPAWQSAFLEFARAHEIPAYPLQQGLVDQDYTELRLDRCCHYNATGHQALVPIMTRIVLDQVYGKRATL